MRKRMAVIIGTALLGLSMTAGCMAQEEDTMALDSQVSDNLHASIQHEVDSPDWVKALPYAQDEETTQLFVVAAMDMDRTTAFVSMHERDENGEWKQILSTPGFVGKNGLCADEDHAEGCAQTPVGIYHFNKAFGIADDPGCALDYVKVDDDTYWSGDPSPAPHCHCYIWKKECINTCKYGCSGWSAWSTWGGSGNSCNSNTCKSESRIIYK